MDHANRYALIGSSVEGSCSPRLHEIISGSGLFEKYYYEAVSAKNRNELIRLFSDSRYSGYNITMPYKRDAMSCVDKISDNAKAVRATNTVIREGGGTLTADNTDIYGFVKMLENAGIKGRTCLILGTGGAASAAYEGLKRLGAREIINVSRDASKGISYERINTGDPEHDSELYTALSSEVIINATPVGMFPDAASFPPAVLERFGKMKTAVDLIYNPLRTSFLQKAEDLGAKTLSGISMLVWQAIRSVELWQNQELSEADKKMLASEAIRTLTQEKTNIVLIGMPGSGKSSISRRLARQTGREFVDLDRITERILGRPIAEEIIKNGEGAFRAAESKAVREACSRTNAVIATGGGTIVAPENRLFLRSNGIIVYIKRPTGLLSKKNRPLSKSVGVETLYKMRADIYESIADVEIENIKTFGSTRRENGKTNSFNYDINFFAAKIKRRVDEKIRGGWLL